MPQFSRDSFEQNRQLMTFIQSLAELHHATPAQVSLAWMLNRKPYIVPIPGTRHETRLRENIGAADIMMTADEVKKIDEMQDKMPMSRVFGGSKVVAQGA